MRHLTCAALLSLCAITPALADTLKLPVSQQGQTDLSRPSHGISMAEVEARWGAPLRKQGPVGTPPISRWEYAQFNVVFEGQYVLRSVLKPANQPPAPSAPTPVQEIEPSEDLFK